MNYKALFCIMVFLLLTGCAATKEPTVTREPKRLITKDDYKDLKIKPCEKKPVEVDYKKEGTTIQSIDALHKNK